MKVTEIFYSIQGESTYAGRPCIFIRLTGCNLRCTYCDTTYSFHGGISMTPAEILHEISQYPCKLVEITGGEPMEQPETPELAARLLDEGYEVLMETNGAFNLEDLDRRIVKIVDLKTPGSGEVEANCWANLDQLQPNDEVKFVICNRADFEWANSVVREYALDQRVTVLFSPSFQECASQDLAEWILKSGLNVRMQLQLHKFIWDPQTQGV